MPLSIQFTGRDVELDEPMRRDIEKALRPIARRLKRVPADMAQTDVVVERLETTNEWQVRITLGAGAPDHTFTSTEKASTLLQAARLAADDIIDQITRFREKVQRQEHSYEEARALKEQGRGT